MLYIFFQLRKLNFVIILWFPSAWKRAPGNLSELTSVPQGILNFQRKPSNICQTFINQYMKWFRINYLLDLRNNIGNTIQNFEVFVLLFVFIIRASLKILLAHWGYINLKCLGNSYLSLEIIFKSCYYSIRCISDISM